MSVRVIRKSLIVLIHQAARMRTGRDVTRASDGNIILISLPIYFSLEINAIQATIIRITKKHPLFFLTPRQIIVRNVYWRHGLIEWMILNLLRRVIAIRFEVILMFLIYLYRYDKHITFTRHCINFHNVTLTSSYGE